jgi:hypothetical protein
MLNPLLARLAEASELEDHAAQGQLEEARPLAGQLEAMADELMGQAGGLSIDTLREQAGLAGGSHFTRYPLKPASFRRK